MAREMLRVDKVSKELHQKLREEAKRRFGVENASLLVRALIDECLRTKEVVVSQPVQVEGPAVRVELSIPKSVVDKIDVLAEERFSKRQQYIMSVILGHLGQPVLLNNQIEVLRRSNYEISRIGTNLNQIAKAFNLIVNGQSTEKIPEIGKKIASLRKDIKEHTSVVLSVISGNYLEQEKSKRKRRSKNKS